MHLAPTNETKETYSSSISVKCVSLESDLGIATCQTKLETKSPQSTISDSKKLTSACLLPEVFIGKDWPTPKRHSEKSGGKNDLN